MKKTNTGFTKILLIVLCLVLAFSFAACKGDEKEEPANNDQDSATVEDYPVKLYFANMEYINTGNEELSSMVGPYDYILEDVDIGRQYYELLDVLRDVEPYEGDDAYTMLTDNIKINDAYLEGDTVYIDFSSTTDDGTPLDGGALEELLLVEQLVTVFTESFTEVDKVQFLIDGEVTDTLMGHIAIDQPFAREDIDEIESSGSEEDPRK